MNLNNKGWYRTSHETTCSNQDELAPNESVSISFWHNNCMRWSLSCTRGDCLVWDAYEARIVFSSRRRHVQAGLVCVFLVLSRVLVGDMYEMRLVYVFSVVLLGCRLVWWYRDAWLSSLACKNSLVFYISILQFLVSE